MLICVRQACEPSWHFVVVDTMKCVLVRVAAVVVFILFYLFLIASFDVHFGACLMGLR